MRGSPAALRCRWKAVETGFGVERRPILAADAVVVIRGPECQPFRELGLAMRAQRLHRGLVERHRLVARLGSFEAVYAGRDTGRAMSQENVEILYRLFEASRRRDKAACVRDSHPDVEIVSYLMGLEGTVYKGHAGMRRYIDGSSDVAGERGGCAPNPGRCAGLHLARRLAARTVPICDRSGLAENRLPKRRLAPLAAKAWTRDLFATAVIPRQTERTTPCMDPP